MKMKKLLCLSLSTFAERWATDDNVQGQLPWRQQKTASHS